jgi:Rod binding domain-containing protein
MTRIEAGISGVSSQGGQGKGGNARIYRAAQDFEALLLGSLLRSLQDTFAGTGQEGTSGGDQYQYMGVMSVASALAKAGGLGLSRPIVRQLLSTKDASSTHGAPDSLVQRAPEWPLE